MTVLPIGRVVRRLAGLLLSAWLAGCAVGYAVVEMTIGATGRGSPTCASKTPGIAAARRGCN